MLYRCKYIINTEFTRICLKILTSLCLTHDSFKSVIGQRVIKYATKYLDNTFLCNTASYVLDRL